MTVIRFSLWLVILCGYGPALYASDQKEIPGRHSPLKHWIMEKLASTNSLQQYARQERHRQPAVESNSTYKEFFHDAQREIGIAEEDILPVVDSVEQSDNAIATAHNRIIIYLENFKNRPYGAQRVMALHEAFHHKYHDAVFDQWFLQSLVTPSLAITIISIIGLETLSALYISNDSLRIAAYIGSPIASIITSSILLALCVCKAGCLEKNLTDHDSFKEYRADSQAVLHANCHQCVSEYDQAFDNRPCEYLNHKELAKYISRFKKENKLCQHHKDSL